MSTERAKLPEASPHSRRPGLKRYDFRVPAEINFPHQPIPQILDLAALQFANIEFVEELPQSAIGKVLRRELRDAEAGARTAL